MEHTALVMISSGLGGISIALIGAWVAIGKNVVTRTEHNEAMSLVRQMQVDQVKTTTLLEQLTKRFDDCREEHIRN